MSYIALVVWKSFVWEKAIVNILVIDWRRIFPLKLQLLLSCLFLAKKFMVKCCMHDIIWTMPDDKVYDDIVCWQRGIYQSQKMVEHIAQILVHEMMR